MLCAMCLSNLEEGTKGLARQEAYKSAFSLTAVTGAGKTVMAAAVFEALFHGDDEFDFDADPGAVVIWFSDDPALNEQTRFRLMEASDRLNHTDLVPVENTFNRASLKRRRSISSTRRSSARTACWCAASIKKKWKQKPVRGCWNSVPTCAHSRSGTPSRTPLKTRT